MVTVKAAVSDGAGGVTGERRVCVFITEFIAPGGRKGRRGGGVRQLHDLWAEAGRMEEGEVHGYVKRGNARAERFWRGRGLSVIRGWEGEEGTDEWADGCGVTRRVFATVDPGTDGYMRGTWAEVGGRLRGHAAVREGVRRVVRFYETREEMEEDVEVYGMVMDAVVAEHQRDGGDGMTLEEVMGETEGDRRMMGSIKYVITLAEPVTGGEGGRDGVVAGGSGRRSEAGGVGDAETERAMAVGVGRGVRGEEAGQAEGAW